MMFTWEFLILWFGWLIAGGSPGPATLAIAGTAMSRGRRSGFFVSLGILAGSASWGMAAVFGLSAIMLTNVWLFEMIRYAGAAYLLFLAAKALRSALKTDVVSGGTPFNGNAGTLFVKGALLHLTNPKAVLGWGSYFAVVVPQGASVPDLLAYAAVLYAGSIVTFVGYAFLFSTERVVRGYARGRRWFDLTFAGFFGFADVKILTARP